mmetsp:Transcript_13562/g.29361  ORF Transcript_13562/g.29361 Transcript_13562/m.29361 type:complete len:125 (-) Transcript_13562:119-493(-)
MNPSFWLALCTLRIARIRAFCVVGRPLSLPTSPSRMGMSSPGGWENDDFLNSLGGGGGDYDAANEGYYEQAAENNVEQIVPENDMTDDEITMMAMRASQFYNTDTPIEEVYGVQREGPPRKQEE